MADYKKALTMIKEVNPYKQISVPKDLSYETVEADFSNIYLQLERIHNAEHHPKEVTVKEVLEQLDKCRFDIATSVKKIQHSNSIVVFYCGYKC